MCVFNYKFSGPFKGLRTICAAVIFAVAATLEEDAVPFAVVAIPASALLPSSSSSFVLP